MNPKRQKSKPPSGDGRIPERLGDEPDIASGSDPALAPPFSLRKTAHDLRNSLNVVRNAAYLLRRKLVAAGGDHVDLVDMIEDSVKSAEIIATQIMDQAIQTGEPPVSGHAPPPK